MTFGKNIQIPCIIWNNGKVCIYLQGMETLYRQGDDVSGSIANQLIYNTLKNKLL